METFLFVCKLIGISVAVLLLLLLILGLLLLFHSAKYKLQIKAGEELFLRFRIRFLFPLFNFCGDYKNKKMIIKLRILGITVYDMERSRLKKEKKQAKKRKRNKLESTRQNANQQKTAGQEKVQGTKQKGYEPEENVSMQMDQPSFLEESYEEWKARKEAEESGKTAEQKSADSGKKAEQNLTDTAKKEGENATDTEASAKKDGFFAKYKRMFLKIKEILGKIYNIIKQIPVLLSKVMDFIRLLFEKKALISEFIQDEDIRSFFQLSKLQFLALGKHIKPKKLRGHLIIGTGAPDTTGQLIGVLSLFIQYYGNYLQITPDFEEQRLEGDLYAKGRIRSITVLWILKKWLWNDTMKRSKKRAMKLKEELSNGR